MKKEKLQVLGINASRDYSAEELLRLSSSELCETGIAHKAGILREFCEEFYASKKEKSEAVTTASIAAERIAPFLRCLDHEECWVLLLDAKNRVADTIRISSGTKGACMIDVPRIAKHAVIAGATGVILAHNHPSGDPTPGMADIKETARLKKALDLFTIHLLDHIVIGDGEYYSFSEECRSPLKKKD